MPPLPHQNRSSTPVVCFLNDTIAMLALISGDSPSSIGFVRWVPAAMTEFRFRPGGRCIHSPPIRCDLTALMNARTLQVPYFVASPRRFRTVPRKMNAITRSWRRRSAISR